MALPHVLESTGERAGPSTSSADCAPGAALSLVANGWESTATEGLQGGPHEERDEHML